MKENIRSVVFHFRDPNGRMAKCLLAIYGEVGKAVVVATELDDNPGMSITNAAEQLAMQVCQTFNLTPALTLWFERYAGRDEVDMISFRFDNFRLYSPIWRRLGGEASHILEPIFGDLDDAPVAEEIFSSHYWKSAHE